MRLVDSPMRPIIILDDTVGDPNREAERWVRELDTRWSDHGLGEIARKLQRHTVGAPPAAWRAMREANVLEIVREAEFGDQFAVLLNPRLYNARTGLTWDSPSVLDVPGLVI